MSSMSIQEWDIHAPTEWVYTAAEIGVIVEAAQQFQTALAIAFMPKDPRGVAVTLHGIGIATIEVAESPQVAFGPVPCSICDQPVPVGDVHTHSTDEVARHVALALK